MSEFISLLVPGAVAGSIYAVMACGLVLTYSTSGIFNFAHGAIAFCCALVYFQLRVAADLSIWVAAPITICLVAPGLGLVLDRVMLRRLASAPTYAKITGTVGLLVALPNLLLWIIEQANLRGADLADPGLVFPAPGIGPSPAKVWTVSSSITVNSDQLIVLALSFVAAGALWGIVRFTTFGLSLRADVDRRELAQLRGVNTTLVSGVSWSMSTMLAGLGGVLLAPLFGLDPTSYTSIVLGSLAAVVFAGFRSLPIAFAVGVGMGVLQNLVAGYGDRVLPDLLTGLTGFRTAVPFMLALAGLAFARGEHNKVRVIDAEAPPADLATHTSARSVAGWGVAAAALGVYVAVVADDYWAGLVARGLVYAVIFLSITVITGLGGMVSLSQATFVTVGAFAAGAILSAEASFNVPLLVADGRVNLIVALPGAAVVAGAMGLIVAYSVRRSGPLTLALMTLVIALIADLIVFQFDLINNDQLGYRFSDVELWGADLNSPRAQAALFGAVFLACAAACHTLRSSRIGRAILATRSSERAAASVGISGRQARAIVFAVSAALAGVGGCLYGISAGSFTKTTAPPLAGLLWITIVATLGVRRPSAALIAGLSFGVGSALLDVLFGFSDVTSDLAGSVYFLPVLFGLNAVSLARNPDGVLALLGRRTPATARVPDADTAPVDPEQGRDAKAVNGNVVRIDLRQIAPNSGQAAPATAVPALVVEGLRAGYGELDVLEDVGFVVPAGAVVALVGPNGSGKSTLVGALGGSVAAKEGRVILFGDDVTGLAAHDRTRRGVVVLPESRGVFPGLTVDDNLRLVLRTQQLRDKVYDQFPSLAARRKINAGLLSGGEQQMLALGAPIADPPRICVIDEPTLGLAPLICDQVWSALQLLSGLGTTLIVSEEKAANAVANSQLTLVLVNGSVRWYGASTDLDRSQIAEQYLGVAPLAVSS